MSLSDWLMKRVGNYLTKSRPHEPSMLCDFGHISQELKMADILLIEGQNRISRIIQRVTQSPWSHAALYIGRIHDIEDAKVRELIHHHYQGPPSDQLIIEGIIGKGTIVSNIKEYKNDHIRICRAFGLAHKDAQRIVTYAARSIGGKYDMRHFFDLGRFLIRSRFVPRRFHSSLFNYAPDEFPSKPAEDICSAMIARSFGSVKFPILPYIHRKANGKMELIQRNPYLFTPRDFDYSPFFNIIKYPVFSISEHAPYKELPWNEQYISNDDMGIYHANGDRKKLLDGEQTL